MIRTCNELTTNKIISISENKRIFRINNSSLFSINRVEVDGCYITSGRKCDYLFEILDSDILEVFYVELKGKHLEDAIEQLEETLKYCLGIHKSINRSCFIVASRVPKASTSTQKMKKEFKRKHGVMLYIDTKIKEVKV
ncbi:MAG: hypothetical protein GXO60_08725 [Epsilonproteobacteria bacterium]|nr:hypothetical protein [Campylobacterota bacterium]